jgi:hypothetical protein
VGNAGHDMAKSAAGRRQLRAHRPDHALGDDATLRWLSTHKADE